MASEPDFTAAMQAELAFLRAEMELNRKYIFERPLLIVAGGITAAGGLQQLVAFDVLPLVFVTLVAYNLWFTFNRLQSNARIISYLQVFHRRGNEAHWIGWEASLRDFRHFPVIARKRYAQILKTKRNSHEYSENRFYGPIFLFHLISAVALTGFLLAQIYPQGIPFGSLPALQRDVAILDLAALAAFLLLAWRFRPGRVRHTIAITRDVWETIAGINTLPPTPEGASTS